MACQPFYNIPQTDQVVEAICQLWHNNQNAKIVVILFGEHSIIGDYAKAIKYKYKSPQVWMTNNWEIICFGSPKEVVFHQSPKLPTFLSFSSKLPVVLKSGNHPVNYVVKPVNAMHHFIKMFSNPGDTVIDAFAGMHTTSIDALLENRNVIAIEVGQSQWLSAQHHLKEVVNSMVDDMPISSSPSSSCSRRNSSEEKKATSALQPSHLAPVQSPQLISTPSPTSLDTSMDEFFPSHPPHQQFLLPINLSASSASSQQKKKKKWRSVLMFLARVVPAEGEN